MMKILSSQVMWSSILVLSMMTDGHRSNFCHREATKAKGGLIRILAQVQVTGQRIGGHLSSGHSTQSLLSYPVKYTTVYKWAQM